MINPMHDRLAKEDRKWFVNEVVGGILVLLALGAAVVFAALCGQ